MIIVGMRNKVTPGPRSSWLKSWGRWNCLPVRLWFEPIFAPVKLVYFECYPWKDSSGKWRFYRNPLVTSENVIILGDECQWVEEHSKVYHRISYFSCSASRRSEIGERLFDSIQSEWTAGRWYCRYMLFIILNCVHVFFVLFVCLLSHFPGLDFTFL